MAERTRFTWLILTTAVSFGAPVRGWAGETPPPSYFRMKQVKVMDSHGFEKPLTALTLLVPTDWRLEGGVTYDPKNACTATMAAVAFRAVSPDGRTAVELFPSGAWSWSDDPGTRQFMDQDRRTKAQFGMRACDMGPPLAAKEYLSKHLVPRARSGARVLGVEVDPEAAKAVQQMARGVEAELAKVGVNARVKADTARVRVAYEQRGQPQEEWVAAVTYARAVPAPTYNLRTGQMGQALSYACGADYVFGAAAPAGRLEATEKLFRAIIGSVRIDPTWQARVQQAQANIEAAAVKGAADRSRIIAKSAEDTRRIVNESYQRRQESQDRTSHEWSQAIRGVQTMRNPSTGELVEVSNRSGTAWSNGKEYVISDTPGFDPNSVSNERWTRLEPVR